MVKDFNIMNVKDLIMRMNRKCLYEYIQEYINMSTWNDENIVILNQDVYSKYDSRSV